jgi:hypothetical protein
MKELGEIRRQFKALDDELHAIVDAVPDIIYRVDAEG